ELKKRMPKVYAQLEAIKDRLENRYRDMQDMEFTVQEGRLHLLQTRSGKATARAAVRIAVEMVRKRLIDRSTAVSRIDAGSLQQLLVKTVDPSAKYTALTQGPGAPPGAATGAAATGTVVFDPDRAVEKALHEEKVILVRAETSPEDVAGMHASQGIL